MFIKLLNLVWNRRGREKSLPLQGLKLRFPRRSAHSLVTIDGTLQRIKNFHANFSLSFGSL